MSNSMFEMGLELEVESQNVSFQSLALIENSSQLSTLVSGEPSASSTCSNSFVFEDEGDLFQCGRCKRQFNSLAVFVHHKREGCPTVLMSSYAKRIDARDSKSLQDEFSKTHFISDSGHRIDQGIPERSYEETPVSVISSMHHHQHSNHQDHLECGSSILSESTPVIHFTPSIVIGEETMSFTIPVDQNSGLAHLVNGSNSSQVLSISESELAALISAGERYHLSTMDQSNNSIPSHSILLTTSIMPSNGKETSTIQMVTDVSSSPRYVEITGDVDDQHQQENTNFSSERVDEENELPLIISKVTPNSEMVNVIRIQKSRVREASKVAQDGGNQTDSQNNENHSASMRGESSLGRMNSKKHSQTEDGRSIVVDKSKSQSVTDVKRKCDYCGKHFKKLFNLHQHIRSHTGEKPFHCLVCGRGFTQKSNVKKHMQTHKVWPKVKYTLPKEQISVKVKNSLEKPIEGDQNETNGESVEYVVNNVYVCQYCDLHFENYHKLKTHLSHTHKNEKLFKCIHKDCLATFLEVEGLICHMKTHEDQIEYQCQNCPKKFKTLYDLGAHQYSHRLYPNKISTTAPKQFRCTKCNSKYASSEALNHHLLTSSHNYPCSQCSLTFVCERYLRRHLRIHGTVEPFRCDLCGKMFKTENYLKSHLVIHSNLKPFHCDICKQSFNRRDKLTRHKLMHDNRKKYKCPFKNTGCEREFYRKDKLKDHMMSHSRKVYTCSKCSKSFSWPTRLRQHQAAHHPEMMINTTCPTCQKIFKTKHHLKIHVCREVGVHNHTEDSTGGQVMINEQEIKTAEVMLVGGESVNKVVLYNDCDIEDGINSSGEKSEDEAMLGNFSNSEDPDAVILTRYSECEDRDINHDVDGNGGCIMGPMEMTFENSDDGHMEMMAAD